MSDIYRQFAWENSDGKYLSVVCRRAVAVGWRVTPLPCYKRLPLLRILFGELCKDCGVSPLCFWDEQGYPAAYDPLSKDPVKQFEYWSMACECWKCGMAGSDRNFVLLRCLEKREETKPVYKPGGSRGASIGRIMC